MAAVTSAIGTKKKTSPKTLLWSTQIKDKEGNQIGNADFSPNRKVALYSHKDMSNKIFNEIFNEDLL